MRYLKFIWSIIKLLGKGFRIKIRIVDKGKKK